MPLQDIFKTNSFRKKFENLSIWETNSNNKETKPTHRPPNPQHIRERGRAGGLGGQKGALIYGSNQIPE